MPDTADGQRFEQVDDLDAVAARLYALVPDEFVPARDDAVAAARDRGDRDLARAIGRLRRPNRAAWLSNLLAGQRREQLDALLTLAGDLAAAQRTLDGDALRALSSQRHRLVAAMAREAGRLARAAGEPVGDGLLRELAGILEAALADPGVAAEVRAGRLTRTLTYSGFGPVAGGVPRPPDPPPGPPAFPAGPGTGAGPGPREAAQQRERLDRERRDHERQERELREREQQERNRRERDLAAAERDEAAARGRQDVDDAARDDTEAAHADARDRVAVLTAELEAARGRERDTGARARAAAATAKDSARAVQSVATRAARARARLDELPGADDPPAGPARAGSQRPQE